MKQLPECVSEYIDGLVRDLGLRRQVCIEIRQELVDHFEDALCRVEGEVERTRRAEALIVQFGDKSVLTTLIQRGKQRCREKYIMNMSGITGLVFFILLVGLALLNIWPMFVNFPSIAICIGGPIALGVMSYGTRDLLRGVWALRVLLVRVPSDTFSWRETAVLRGLIGSIYTSGVIGTAIGFIQLLTILYDESQWGPPIAFSLLCPFYSVLIAEGLVRPAVRHIEHNQRVDSDKPQELDAHEPVTKPEIAE